MTLPLLEKRITLPKKPSTHLLQMQLGWGLVYSSLRPPRRRPSHMILTDHYHNPGDTGHNAELVEGSGGCYRHTCASGNRDCSSPLSPVETSCTGRTSGISPTVAHHCLQWQQAALNLSNCSSTGPPVAASCTVMLS